MSTSYSYGPFIPRGDIGADSDHLCRVDNFINQFATKLSDTIKKDGELKYVPSAFYVDMNDAFKREFESECDGTESPYGINRYVLARAHIFAGVPQHQDVPKQGPTQTSEANKTQRHVHELMLAVDALEKIVDAIFLCSPERIPDYQDAHAAIIAAIRSMEPELR